MIPTIYLDSGNYRVKAVCGASKTDFLHLIAPITKAQFEDGLTRFKDRKNDFVYIREKITEGKTRSHYDDFYFAIGESALTHDTMRRQGATRYERLYYGPMFCGVVGRFAAWMGQQNTKNAFIELKREGLRVVASHASRDHRFAGNLKSSLTGPWEFRCGDNEFITEVSVEDVYEEPFGGFAKRAFVKDEHGRWTTPLEGLRIAIIDIGGGTVGVLKVNDGNVDYNTADSAGQGVNLAVDRLKDTLKAQHPTLFGQAKDIPASVLQNAIRTGLYVGKGTSFDVTDAVEEALYPLLNEVKTLWSEKLNAGLDSDRVLFTGGGSVLLGAFIEKFLGFPKESVIYATDSLGDMQYANVDGAKQFYDCIESF